MSERNAAVPRTPRLGRSRGQSGPGPEISFRCRVISYGHPAGARPLVRAARILTRQVRRGVREGAEVHGAVGAIELDGRAGHLAGALRARSESCCVAIERGRADWGRRGLRRAGSAWGGAQDPSQVRDDRGRAAASPGARPARNERIKAGKFHRRGGTGSGVPRPALPGAPRGGPSRRDLRRDGRAGTRTRAGRQHGGHGGATRWWRPLPALRGQLGRRDGSSPCRRPRGP